MQNELDRDSVLRACLCICVYVCLYSMPGRISASPCLKQCVVLKIREKLMLKRTHMEKELNWVIQYLLPIEDHNDYSQPESKLNTNNVLTGCPEPISRLQKILRFSVHLPVSSLCPGNHNQLGMDLLE